MAPSIGICFLVSANLSDEVREDGYSEAKDFELCFKIFVIIQAPTLRLLHRWCTRASASKVLNPRSPKP